MNNVIERIEFQATAPKRALPGLEYNINRLDALSAAIKRVQAQIAGLSSNAVFRLSAKQYQNLAYNQKGLPQLNVSQLARRMGFPPEDFRKAATLVETEIQSAIGKINRAIERNPAMGKRALAARQNQIKELQGSSYFTDASARQFKNASQAGKFAEHYAGIALKNKQQAERAMAAILSGAAPTFGPVGVGGSITPSHLNKAVQEAVNQANRTAPAGKKKATGGSRKTADATGNDVVETRTTTPDDTDKPVRTVVKRSTGKGVITETVHEGDELLKTTVTDAVGQRAKVELREQLRLLKENFQAGLPATAGRPGALKGLTGDLTRETGLLMQKFGPLGLGGMIDTFNNQTVTDVLRRHQRGQARSGGSLDKQRNAAQTRDFITEYRAQQSAMAALDKQRQRETSADYLKAEKAKAATGAALDKQRQRETTKNFYRENAEQAAAAQVAAAQMTVAKLRAGGATKIPGGRMDAITGQILSERYRLGEHQYDVNYGKGGASVTQVEKMAAVAKKTRLQSAVEGLTTSNMAANILKVGSWAAAVGILYKSFDLARYSLERLEKTGAETAHLGIVFRGVGGDAQQLTNDIIGLTAAQGRETSEMVESATEWARLGGDRAKINEEVRLSAMAANIGNMSLAESTKQLQSLMHIYGLDVNGLTTALGGLVNTSLKYNVTLDEMFVGLDRSAAAAKVAGVSLSELQAMIGVVVGATGQTGSMTGNSLKYIFQELQKPEVQRQLRGFGVEPLGNNLEMKPAGQILGDLSSKWGTLGSHAQQQLSGLLGGRFNAARVPIVMEDYPRILKLAIDAQLNLNGAQAANVKILDTLKAQLAGVRAEFDKLVVSAGAGPMQGLTKGATALKFALDDLANKFTPTPGGSAKQQREATMNQLWHTKAMSLSRIMGVARATGSTLFNWGSHPEIPGLMDEYNYFHEQKARANQPAGQDAYQQQQGDLQRNIGADRYRQQEFGNALVQLRNGTLTQRHANDYAEILQGMDPKLAATFQSAFSSGNLTGATSAMSAASGQTSAKLLQEVASVTALADRRSNELKKEMAPLVAKQTAATMGQGTFSQADQAQLDAYDKELNDLKDTSDKSGAALQQLAGDVDTVSAAMAKFGGQMQAQEAIAGQIERSFKAVHATTAVGGLAQDALAEAAKLAYWQRQQFNTTYMRPGHTLLPEEQGLQTNIQDQILKSRQALEAARDPERRTRAGQLDAQTVRVHQMQSQGVGIDEADKLKTERDYLQDIVKYSHDVNDIEAAKIMLQNNALEIRLKQVDAEREIKQLAIDQNKEFSKSLFSAGPADLLKKLAAFKLAQGHPGMGQMMSLDPSVRGDVGLLTGNNYDMMLAQRNRNKLAGMGGGLPPLATGNPGDPRSPVPVPGDFSFLKLGEAAMNALSSAGHAAATALERLTARADAAFAAMAHAAPANAPAGLRFAAPSQNGGWYPGKVMPHVHGGPALAGH